MNINKIYDAKTNNIGKQIKYFKEIDSTHLEAKKIADTSQGGEILIAEVQNKGIGTKGRKWYTGERKKYSDDNYTKTKMYSKKVRRNNFKDCTNNTKNNKEII